MAGVSHVVRSGKWKKLNGSRESCIIRKAAPRIAGVVRDKWLNYGRGGMRKIVALLSAIMLSACVNQADQKVWVRADGRQVMGNPALMQQYEIDAAICKGETSKAAVGMAPIYYQGLGGAIAAGMIESERAQGLEMVAEGCMAQRGYLHKVVPRKPVVTATGTPAPASSTPQRKVY